ncbi:MAG TPA: DUF1080 domain-containing protein [Verrucomicrobiales bacterium]|nr:DUF1080 domain-containing protein [Verrucomicrobiales bacterium]
MTAVTRRLFVSAAVVGTMCFCVRAADEGKDGWVSLFNGKDLTGWKAPEPNPFWKVVDGVLVGENDAAKKGSMLYTKESYGDFELEGDARWKGEIDSGFMVRKPELQLQFGVSRSLKKDMTGSFYVGGKGYPEEAQAKEAGKLVKEGDWNTYKLVAKGDTFTVWINGTQASQYKTDKYPGAGPIGLQIHGGLAMKVEFRNLKIKPLAAGK